MNIPDVLFPIAVIGTMQAIMQMLPLGLLAVYSLATETILNKFDRTFSASLWFFSAITTLALSEIIWKSWTASTPMADIIRYGEIANQLIFSIITFVILVSAILLWMLILGIRKIVIEAHGSGWGWASLRLLPLLPFAWLLFQALINGNAQIGDAGFINLISH